MRYVASWVVMLAWGLWFGGLVALMLFVTALFGGDRNIARQAAPRLFVAGLLIPAAMRADATRKKAGETAAATAPPASPAGPAPEMPAPSDRIPPGANPSEASFDETRTADARID